MIQHPPHPKTRAEREAVVLRALRGLGPSTQAQLSAATQLSRPTVTSILTKLEQEGIVAQQAMEAGAGRPAAVLGFAESAGLVLGCDILTDTVAVTAASYSGLIVAAQVSDLHSSSPAGRVTAVTRAIKRCLAPLQPSHGRLLAVTAATTGIVDDRGRITRSDLVPQWNGLALADELQAALECPVQVENDINAAAYGEFAWRSWQDPGRHLEHFLYARLSPGLLTGLVIGGQLHRGATWNAGEISDSIGPGLLHDGRPGTDHWSHRAALTLGALASVVDPHLIVISAPEQMALVSSLMPRLAQLRPALAPAINVESSTLGTTATSLGALSLAFQDADRHRLGLTPARPVPIRGLDRLLATHQKGNHSTMSQKAAVKDQDQLRVGIVGVGARSHLALNVEDPAHNAAIVAVCDPHRLTAERVRARLEKDPAGLVITQDLKGLISAGIDAAFVTSPDDTHADITCELLRAGVPVYLEKPLAITLDDATRVLTAAYETGTKLYVGHNMRHMNVVRTMRDVIRAGRIGQVQAIWCRHFVGTGGDFYFKDWHATREHGTGLLLQKAAHDIDVMHWLAESHATDVVGMGDLMVYDRVTDRRDNSDHLMKDWFSQANWPPLAQTGLNPVIDVEDISMLMMRMESGVLASYQQCHFTPDYWRNYTVIGTEGRIENFGDGEGGVVKLWNRRTFHNPDGDEQFPILGDASGHDDADKLTVAEFLRFIRVGGATDTSPLGAWYAVAAGILATESLRDGSTPRSVPPLPRELISYFQNNQVK